MKFIDLPSPNHDDRNHGVDMLILHYTGMPTAEDAIARLCNPIAKVSAHYLVYEDGTILRLVKEDRRAWHAGVSYWRKQTNINARSIGIEIVNPGHEFGYRAFPKVQMDAVASLCNSILSRHAIPARHILAHSDVAPSRKEDPGELFDWQWLSEQGVGLWPQGQDSGSKETASLPESRILNPESLSSYGYDITDPKAAITAFQRHFRPKLLNGEWDAECEQILQNLLESVA